MKRRAILISMQGENLSESKFQTFLHSPFGGAWENDEIKQIKNKTRAEIIAAVKEASNVDYALVVCWGVGRKVKNALPWSEMEVSTTFAEKVCERDFNPGSARCTLIFDCSGDFGYRGSENLSSPMTSSHPLDLAYNQYIQALSDAEGGLVRVYATKLDNNTSPAQPSFTDLMLREANNWLLNNKGVLNFGDAVAKTKAVNQASTNNQTIEYLPGRRTRHFPFAIQI